MACSSMSLLPTTARWGVKPTPDAPAVSDKPALDQAVVAADAAKKELKKVVLDSGAIIKGRRLESLGDAFWTVGLASSSFLVETEKILQCSPNALLCSAV